MRLLSVLVTMVLAAQTLSAAETKPTGVSREEAKEGFKSLFNGKTLEGWQGDVSGYAAENGVLVCKKESGGSIDRRRVRPRSHRNLEAIRRKAEMAGGETRPGRRHGRRLDGDAHPS